MQRVQSASASRSAAAGSASGGSVSARRTRESLTRKVVPELESDRAAAHRAQPRAAERGRRHAGDPDQVVGEGLARARHGVREQHGAVEAHHHALSRARRERELAELERGQRSRGFDAPRPVRSPRTHVQQRARLGEVGIEPERPLEQLARGGHVARLEVGLGQAEHRPRVVGVHREHGPERGARGVRAPGCGVQVAGQEEGEAVARVDVERLGHQGLGLSHLPCAACALGPLEELDGGDRPPPAGRPRIRAPTANRRPDPREKTHAAMIAHGPSGGRKEGAARGPRRAASVALGQGGVARGRVGDQVVVVRRDGTAYPDRSDHLARLDHRHRAPAEHELVARPGPRRWRRRAAGRHRTAPPGRGWRLGSPRRRWPWPGRSPGSPRAPRPSGGKRPGAPPRRRRPRRRGSRAPRPWPRRAGCRRAPARGSAPCRRASHHPAGAHSRSGPGHGTSTNTASPSIRTG